MLKRLNGGNVKADRRSATNNARKRWFRKDILVGSFVALTLAVISAAVYVKSRVRESSQASADQIATSLKGKLANPWHDAEGVSILESDDREIRSAVLDFVKAIAFTEIDSQADREAVSQALDDYAATYVDSGIEEFAGKQSPNERGVWSKIPPLLAQIHESSLSPEWKEYAFRILNIVRDEDAAGHLNVKNTETFERAFEKLSRALPADGSHNEVERNALRQFILDLGKIELLEEINLLRNQLTSPVQESASEVRDR